MRDQETEDSFAGTLGQILFPGPVPLSHAIWARVAGTYDFTAGRLGAHPKAALWRGRWAQRRRFKRLLSVLDGGDSARSDVSLNDFGCGYGALFDLLKGKRYFRAGTYVGYDISATMISLARERIRDPRATFLETPLPTQIADYTVASGTFGLCLDVEDEAWEGWVHKALEQMAAVSRRGFAFNLLYAGRAPHRETLYYAQPAPYLAFLRRTLPGVEPVLICGRRDVDFTILMRF